jgi:hypothetical protein
VRKAVAFANEKALAFEIKPVGIGDRDPGFLAASPFGKMPALDDDGFGLADSSASSEPWWFLSVLQIRLYGKAHPVREMHMVESARVIEGKLLSEQALAGDPHGGGEAMTRGAARSRPVNLAESPLGWLHSRGHVTTRQYEAGERLRWDWERAQLDPQVTMRWDAAPIRRGRGGRGVAPDPRSSQLDARTRFVAAVDSVGPGLADIVWRIICAGEGMRQAETALGWPARAGKLVLGLALDRIADHYRIAQHDR